MNEGLTHIVHPWAPWYDERSRILILGTIPSPASRRQGFYYGHPQNVFWRLLSEILEQPVPPATPEARRSFVLNARIALWDVLHEADIAGASDASIRNPVPNRFAPLLQETGITTIFTTGKTATSLFNTLCAEEAGMQAIFLPSTSPANRAQQSRAEFRTLWQQVARALKQ